MPRSNRDAVTTANGLEIVHAPRLPCHDQTAPGNISNESARIYVERMMGWKNNNGMERMGGRNEWVNGTNG
jgi:hypothetical protein